MYPNSFTLRIKITRRERHTLYRSALFILARVDKALSLGRASDRSAKLHQLWSGPRTLTKRNIYSLATRNTRGDPREVAASVWPSGVIQGHITVFWWHSVSNTSLEMMRADEQLCRRSLYKDHPFARIINFAEVAGPSATFTDVRTAERVAFSRVN